LPKTIQAKVSLIGETISSTIWADKDIAYRLIKQNLEQLSARFQKARLEAESLNCYCGHIQNNGITESMKKIY